MATLRITGITLTCNPGVQFNTLVEYKLDSDISYTSLGNKLTNSNGTFVTPLDIPGLDSGECYDFRFTPSIPGLCSTYVEQACTAISPIWIAFDQECETEGGFGVVKTITNMSSPIRVFWDSVTSRLYVMDIDDPAGNVSWFSNIATATTIANATHSSAVNFDPLYNSYFDDVYRRIYFVGANTGGMIVYDVDGDSMSTVTFGTNFAFSRTTLFVGGNLIICNDGNTNMILIARDTLSVTATIPTASIGVPDHFDNGPQTIVMAANGDLYVASSNADAPDIGVYDTSLNHIVEITLPGVQPWSFGNYWQSIFYDATSDLIFVSDSGSNQRFVIDPNTNTVIDQRPVFNLGAKSNMTLSFSVDPLSGNLFATFSAKNTSSDSSPVDRVYLVDRNTYDFINMFEGANFSNLVGIPDLGWFAGSNAGGVNFAGNPGYNTDGTISILSNSLGGTNTGNVLTLTLQEVLMPGSIPTGNVKPNGISDPDYISPVMDTDQCPLTFNLNCPTDAVTSLTTGEDLEYEFTIPNTVRFNPAVDNIIVYWRLNTIRQSSPQTYTDPTLTNYYAGTFNSVGPIGPGENRDVEVVYRNAANAELNSCILS